MSSNNGSSVHKIMKNGSKNLIVCFGGMTLMSIGMPPFEFLSHLSSMYGDTCDLMFLVDKNQCWYHKGIQDITSSIDETVAYLNNIIQQGTYDKVIFMGISAGGYAAILFGSLCNNVHNVISFIPQTKLIKPVNVQYSDLKRLINKTTKYILYGDLSVKNINDHHHILHCEHINCFPNVKLLKNKECNLKQLRDGGFIKRTIDSIILGL